jgi:hypothetical protein
MNWRMGYNLKEFTSKDLRILYRKLLIKGYTKEEASNLCAVIVGIHAVPRGWKLEELERLLFERYRAATRP